MKILVTGGAGFIGSHVVDRLVKEHEVIVVDDLTGGKIENINSGADFVKRDVRDYETVESLIGYYKPEVIFHLAANAAENKAQFSPVDITERNFRAGISILTAGIKHGMKKFIFTSSIAAYGAIPIPFKETDRPEPEDLYGISKYALEESIKVLSKVHGFDWTIVRPHNVYGPRQNMTDPYRNVVTIFLNAVLHDKPYNIYGDGNQIRCFSYIEPVAEAIAKCLDPKTNGKTYNIGSDIAYTVNDLSKAVQSVTGTKHDPIYLPDRPQEVKVAIADHSLAKQDLGYSDNFDLYDGVSNTWIWAKAQGPQEYDYGEVELPSDKLPANWKK